MNIIETQNLTKSYADFTAVSGINLHIPKGAVYGFLGPNGAGKSTTMKMFLGLTKPTSGSFTIDGKKYPDNRVQILKEIGSFIEAPAFYGNLSGEENLEIIRKILGLPKSSVAEALEIVGLTQFKKRLAKKYSLGIREIRHWSWRGERFFSFWTATTGSRILTSRVSGSAPGGT